MKYTFTLILGLIVFGSKSFGQYQLKLSGFPKNNSCNIKIQSQKGLQKFTTRGDTTLLLRGLLPTVKIYIYSKSTTPVPATIYTKSGSVLVNCKNNGYQVYVNGKLQYTDIKPGERTPKINSPEYTETEIITYKVDHPMGAALTHEPAASDIPRAFKGKMEILKKPTGAISGYQGAMKAGLLTAGEINDFSKWKLWNDLGTGTLNIYKKQWLLNLYKRYSVMVINRSRIPLVNASVKLWREKQLLWEQTTDNTGKAELWLQAMDSAYAQQEDKLWIEVIYGERTKAITHIKSIEKGINKIVFSDACREWNQADIAFIVDATGSMGDEINYLKTELQDVMQQCKTMMPKTNFRLGAVFYRDRGDDYITRCTPLNPDPNLAIQFIQNQRAGGGGDEPEGVDTALSVALSELDWNPDAVARLAFLVLDAPPHSDPFTQQRLVHLTKAAARQGIRLIPLTASGIGKTTEYLMRTLALATNGTYLFLTDDSGIGESHLKPSTDQYKVELLNNLLIRIIRNYTWHPGCDESTIQLPDTANSLADTVLIQEPTDTMPQEVSYFRAYPNPTEGLITLETGKFQGALYLTDMNGKILERFDLENGERLSLDLGQYPPGIYYFKYLMEKGSKDLKVILIRP